MILLPQIFVLGSLISAQIFPAASAGSSVIYYDVEKANFDGSPDLSASENRWSETRVSTFLVADSQDIEADSEGNRIMLIPEVNFYGKPFAYDSHKLSSEAKSAFKWITIDTPEAPPINVDRGLPPQRTVVKEGRRQKIFVRVWTQIAIEKREVGKETIIRKRGYKRAVAIVAEMNEDQWFDPTVSSRDARIRKSSAPEPNWNRRTFEQIQNFLWESPF